MKRRDKFDYVLVETTGLADPGPVAQTFFMDEEIQSEFQLDGIVTLVDAAHINQQLGRSDESTEQIAFADVLVLNKKDLVDDASLDALRLEHNTTSVEFDQIVGKSQMTMMTMQWELRYRRLARPWLNDSSGRLPSPNRRR